MEWKRWLKGVLPFVVVLSAACGPGGGNGDPVCGDGALESDGAKGILEFCDDGNVAGGDGCDAACRLEFNAVAHSCDLPAGFRNGFGGCCNAAADCLSDNCSFGFCELPAQAGCTQDSDCNNALADDALITNASPFPAGTAFTCVITQSESPLFAAGIPLCVPGSGAACDNPADERCPAGETCTFTFDKIGDNQQTTALGGLCTTDYLGSLPAGSFCTGDVNAPYECSAGIFFNNCIGNTCMAACDGADPNGSDACNAGFECLGPLTGIDLFGDNDPSNDIGGGGFCLGANCGGQTVSLGADSEFVDLTACGAGFTCTFFGAFDDINEILYQCTPEDPQGGDYGAACEQDPFFEQGCKNAGLCLQAGVNENNAGTVCESTADCNSATEVCADNNGDGSGHCTARPAPGFCSVICANHDDCNADPLIPSTCIDLDIGQGLSFPACFPVDQIFAPGAVVCDEETDCNAAADEGCLPLALAGIGTRAGLGLCNASADANVATPKSVGEACDVVNFAGGTGTACTVDANCAVANEVCINDGTGSKCRPQITECKSAICADETLGIKAEDNSVTQTFCTSYCITNDDCTANTECIPVLTDANNGVGAGNTIGLCAPSAPANPADNCTVDAAATAHNSCEVNEAAGSGLVCVDDATCQAVDPNDVCFNGACRALVQGEGDSCNIIAGDCFTNNIGAGAACNGDEDCGLGGSCLAVDEVAGTDGFCAFNGCDSTQDGIAAGCQSDEDICLGNGLAAPGTCILGCTVANGNADCGINAALTCQDIGLGNGQGLCLLP